MSWSFAPIVEVKWFLQKAVCFVQPADGRHVIAKRVEDLKGQEIVDEADINNEGEGNGKY